MRYLYLTVLLSAAIFAGEVSINKGSEDAFKRRNGELKRQSQLDWINKQRQMQLIRQLPIRCALLDAAYLDECQVLIYPNLAPATPPLDSIKQPQSALPVIDNDGTVSTPGLSRQQQKERQQVKPQPWQYQQD